MLDVPANDDMYDVVDIWEMLEDMTLDIVLGTHKTTINILPYIQARDAQINLPLPTFTI